MGEKDLIKPFLESNGDVIFGWLNMKPGKPTTFSKLGDSLVFSLPGNPVSCFVTAHLFISRALKILSQNASYEFANMKVKVTTSIKLDKEWPEYHWVNVFSCSKGIFAISTGN